MRSPGFVVFSQLRFCASGVDSEFLFLGFSGGPSESGPFPFARLSKHAFSCGLTGYWGWSRLHTLPSGIKDGSVPIPMWSLISAFFVCLVVSSVFRSRTGRSRFWPGSLVIWTGGVNAFSA